jgi:hypothetical protein
MFELDQVVGVMASFTSTGMPIFVTRNQVEMVHEEDRGYQRFRIKEH